MVSEICGNTKGYVGYKQTVNYFVVLFYMLRIALFQVPIGLTHIWQVACGTGKFVYTIFIIVLVFWLVVCFQEFVDGLCVAEGDVYMCVFEKIGVGSYVGPIFGGVLTFWNVFWRLILIFRKLIHVIGKELVLAVCFMMSLVYVL
jgi:hypothetical protein